MEIKSRFKFYVESNIHVAMAVCSLLLISMLTYCQEISFALVGLIFFGTITGYNFIKYPNLFTAKTSLLQTDQKQIQVLSFFSVIGMLIFSFLLPINTLLVICFFAFFSFLYAVPLYKFKKLRSVTGIKIFIVAWVWAGVCFLVPIFHNHQSFTLDIGISFLQYFLFVFVLTLPFEIRDVNFDDLALGTIPQKIGIRNTKLIGLSVLIFILVLEMSKSIINLPFRVSYIIINVLLLVFLFFSTKKQDTYYASFWVEAIPIIWLLLFVFLEVI